MRATLRQEVVEHLTAHGPLTASALAIGVRARRDDVDEVLAGGGFTRVPHPEGASPRAVYFDVSEHVPRTRTMASRRADLLLEILRDGRSHSRDEIWRLTEAFFLTNNAASELRRRGHQIVYERGTDSYRLIRQQEPHEDVAA